MTLDDFDRRILDILQTDCTRAHAEIGDEVGLSGSAVRRRIQAMRAAGVIAHEVAILSDTIAGLTVIVTVEFERETPDIYAAFAAAMRTDERVLQCYATTGRFDVVMLVAAASADDYKAWADLALLSNASVRRYETFVASSQIKFTTRRPATALKLSEDRDGR